MTVSKPEVDLFKFTTEACEKYKHALTIAPSIPIHLVILSEVD